MKTWQVVLGGGLSAALSLLLSSCPAAEGPQVRLGTACGAGTPGAVDLPACDLARAKVPHAPSPDHP